MTIRRWWCSPTANGIRRHRLHRSPEASTRRPTPWVSGLPSNISVPALTTLCQGHQGYLLITGAFSTDQSMRLSKYFLQILAGVTNAQIAADPGGVLDVNSEHRIPFWICEADFGMDLIVLSPLPYLIDFQLEAPDGSRIDPGSGAVGANAQFVLTNRVAYYRCALPVLPANATGSHAGRWYAVLKLARKGRAGYSFEAHAVAPKGVLPYELVAHTYSSLTFASQLAQKSFEVGAVAELSASLLEYGTPPAGKAVVWAEIQRPGGGLDVVSLALGPADRYVSVYTMPIPGVYTARIRARGEIMYGMAFEREQTFTAVAIPGGDHWSPDDPKRDVLCELVDCLRRSGVVGSEAVHRLEALGFNIGALLKCLDRKCHPSREGIKQIEGVPTSRPISSVSVEQLAEAIVQRLKQ